MEVTFKVNAIVGTSRYSVGQVAELPDELAKQAEEAGVAKATKKAKAAKKGEAGDGQSV